MGVFAGSRRSVFYRARRDYAEEKEIQKLSRNGSVLFFFIMNKIKPQAADRKGQPLGGYHSFILTI